MPETIPYTATFVLAKKNLRVQEICRETFAQDAPITNLSIHKAFEFPVQTERPDALQKQFKADLERRNIKADICVQPTEGRRKKLLICDMDSTLIGQECIDELADYAGVKDRVSEITERAMHGEIDFESALIERVDLLKGLPLSDLQTCFDKRIRLNPGAQTLAATMRKFNARTVIVSGGFTFFTQRVAALAEFEHTHANRLGESGDRLSGTVEMPILGRQAKLDALHTHSQSFGGPAAALAIGDGANDLAMIKAAGLGIAYRAKPAVAQAAHCVIDQTDLTTALYFQGYFEDQFEGHI